MFNMYLISRVSGLERPTLSHLLQAAHLFWQQIVRGIPKDIALISSFSDVYIKPRSGADFASDINMSLAENKNLMLKSLEDKIRETSIEISDTETASHTLTVKGLCSDSSFEEAKQIVFSALQEMNSFPCANINIHIICGLFSAYQKCSKNLNHVCNKLLEINLNPISNDLKEVTNQLNSKLFKFTRFAGLKMSGHKRLYPEMYKLSETEIKITNIEEVIVFAELRNILIERFIPEFSVLAYSKAVLSGSMVDEFPEYPILKYCHQYLASIDSHVAKALKASIDFDDVTACKVMQVLNWRHRLFIVTLSSIMGPSKRGRILSEDIVALLYAHCKWVHKHMMGEIFQHLPAGHTLIEDFDNQSRKIMHHYDQDNTEMMKVSKKLKKLYGQPKLYASKEEYVQSVLRTTIYGKVTLNMNQPLSKQLDKLSADGASLTDVSLALDITDTNTLSVIEENIPKVQVITPQTISDIMFLPVASYVLLRVITLLQTSFHDIVSRLSRGEQCTGNDVTVLSNLVQQSRLIRGFPPAFLNLLEIILKIAEGQDIQR